jgi:transposase
MWSPVFHGPCLESLTGAGTRRGSDSPLETGALAGAKKNAQRRGQTIVFVDESGLSERPHRLRTWAPRGQTPVLQYHFNWKTLSVMAGITWWNFYFQLFPGAIKAPQIIIFLQHLMRYLRRPLLVIWDGLPGHRSAVVRDFVTAQGRQLTLEWLPGYAPELNPVEHIWSYLKERELPNFCPPRIVATACRSPRGVAPDAPPAHSRRGILETSRTALSVTILCSTL